jgi:hypothetical protein
VYDYWLGGKDNFGPDREVGAAVAPWIVPGVRANRAFLRRAVNYVARQGISLYLDLGAGLPTRPSVHQIAQARNPQARVIYLDNDPVVLAHARALLARDARTVVAAGDARDPAGMLADPVVAGHLDWSRPVCVLLGALLHFLTDKEDPAATVAALRAVMVPGSFLVVSHCTPGAGRAQGAAVSQAVRLYREQAAPFVPRTPDRIASWLEGLDLISPGLVALDRWRAKPRRPGPPMPMLACVARVPHGQPGGGKIGARDTRGRPAPAAPAPGRDPRAEG